MTWTEADQRRMDRLAKKKRDAELKALKPLEACVEEFFFYNIMANEVVSALVANADTVVLALAPFCDKYEVHKTRKKARVK